MSKGSCPVCYEKYYESENVVPRRMIECPDIICTKCIQCDISDDGTFFCPECSAENKVSSIEDFQIVPPLDLNDNDSADESNGRSESPFTDPETDSHQSGQTGKHSRSNSDGVSSFAKSSHDQEASPRHSQSLRLIRDNSQDDIRTNRSKSKDFDSALRVMGGNDFSYKHAKSNDLLLQASVESFAGLEMSSINLVSVEGKRLKMKDSKGGWPEAHPDELMERFKAQKRMELGEALNLIDQAKTIVSREPTVLRLCAPLIVVGDIHGQFYDFLNILRVGGKPGKETYLFLGDYVDRGSFSCEVMLSLLALKVTYPDRYNQSI